MEKTINGIKYYLPKYLTPDQEAIFCHIINWKRKNITKDRGWYKGHEYDAFFPVGTSSYAMTYKPIISYLEEMQHGDFAYKLHEFTPHAVSSQMACINLFMTLLLSEQASHILKKLSTCPSNFKEIARDKLYHGFCFEYWGQDVKKGKGVLNDHCSGAGTDADVAISYYDNENNLCLWLIEHKLSEKEFTTCGGYNSKNNVYKDNCIKCSLTDIANEPLKCYYHKIKYKYWDIYRTHEEKYQGNIQIIGCPFREGLNQLWRNQLLGFALQETGVYKNTTFSVCHHAKNRMLNQSILRYKELTCRNKMFNSFTNYDVLNAVNDVKSDLHSWLNWYKDVYCF